MGKAWDEEDEEEEVRGDWDDEDAEDVKESWEIDSEEEREKEKLAAARRKEKERIESEQKALEKKAKQAADQLRLKEEEEERNESPAERKARTERMAKESDLAATRDLFGVIDGKKSTPREVHREVPSTVETPSIEEAKKAADLQPFIDSIGEAVLPVATSHLKLYPSMLDSLIRKLVDPLEASDLRKISSTLSALLSEKQKKEREIKSKDAQKKATVKMATKNAVDTTDYGQDEGADEYDFM